MDKTLEKVPCASMSGKRHKVRIWGMSWAKTVSNNFPVQLGLLRQRSCNQKVSCLIEV